MRIAPIAGMLVFLLWGAASAAQQTVRAAGLSGLMDIALHPQFAQNRFGTGHLERILFNEKMEELRRESLLGELRQRIRDVRQGPDELLYVLTDDRNGALLRIEPAQ